MSLRKLSVKDRFLAALIMLASSAVALSYQFHFVISKVLFSTESCRSWPDPKECEVNMTRQLTSMEDKFLEFPVNVIQGTVDLFDPESLSAFLPLWLFLVIAPTVAFLFAGMIARSFVSSLVMGAAIAAVSILLSSLPSLGLLAGVVWTILSGKFGGPTAAVFPVFPLMLLGFIPISLWISAKTLVAFGVLAGWSFRSLVSAKTNNDHAYQVRMGQPPSGPTKSIR